MRVVLVDTKGFWAVMCKPAFVRLTVQQGRIGDVLYLTFCAPEQSPGFVHAKLLSEAYVPLLLPWRMRP
jgi:hypothetical protein